MTPGFWKYEETFEFVQLNPLDPLDISGLLPTEGPPSPSHKAVLQMIEGWELIKQNFDLLWATLQAQDKKGKHDQAGLRAQLQESMDDMNDVGVKACLLSAKLGRNPKAELEGDTTLWEALGEVDNKVKSIGQSIDTLPQAMKETYDTLRQHGLDILRLTTNTTKMYTHYKSHLGINNARLVDIER
jgi:hypothetical protein